MSDGASEFRGTPCPGCAKRQREIERLARLLDEINIRGDIKTPVQAAYFILNEAWKEADARQSQ